MERESTRANHSVASLGNKLKPEITVSAFFNGFGKIQINVTFNIGQADQYPYIMTKLNIYVGTTPENINQLVDSSDISATLEQGEVMGYQWVSGQEGVTYYFTASVSYDYLE